MMTPRYQLGELIDYTCDERRLCGRIIEQSPFPSQVLYRIRRIEDDTIIDYMYEDDIIATHWDAVINLTNMI